MSVGAATGSLVLAGPLVAFGGMSLLAWATVPLNLPLILLLRRSSATRPVPTPVESSSGSAARSVNGPRKRW
jgi:hypothetical protein